MTDNVIDFRAARERRGHTLTPEERRMRPTLVEAIRQYNAATFADAGTINVSRVVHLVHTRKEAGQHMLGWTRCGQHGIVGHPDLHGLVCLRCWPWWKA